jgi:hypothetical protein
LLTSARLTLKHHRFEVGIAALVAILIGVAALVVDFRLHAVNVPAGCFETWLSNPFDAGDCDAPVRAFAGINEEEAGKVFAAMVVLPFIVGLLGGVPIVGRELEARTAQTAWSLSGSRLRWLLRQLVPIAITLGCAVAFAAFAAGVLEATRVTWQQSGSEDLALHGWPVVGRAFAALGLGLSFGGLLGRTLQAFILGAVFSLVIVFAAGVARDQWLFAQRTFIDAGPDFNGHTWGSAWFAPDGTEIDEEVARAQVPATVGVDDRYQWLSDNGYRNPVIGVREEVALGWAPYEALGFTVVGAVFLAAATVVVNRRRPG